MCTQVEICTNLYGAEVAVGWGVDKKEKYGGIPADPDGLQQNLPSEPQCEQGGPMFVRCTYTRVCVFFNQTLDCFVKQWMWWFACTFKSVRRLYGTAVKTGGRQNTVKYSEQHELSEETKRLLCFLLQREVFFFFFQGFVKLSDHQSKGLFSIYRKILCTVYQCASLVRMYWYLSRSPSLRYNFTQSCRWNISLRCHFQQLKCLLNNES